MNQPLVRDGSLMQPTLLTERLAVRPAASSDAGALWALWTDPAVRRFLFDDRTITRDEARETLDGCLTLAGRGLGLWVLVARSASADDTTSDIYGCAGLLPVSTAAEFEPRLTGMIEPLVALAPRVQGRGFAAEALAVLMRHASTMLGIHRLAGVADVPNLASHRMLRRAGFTVLSETSGPRYPMRTYLWEAGGVR